MSVRLILSTSLSALCLTEVYPVYKIRISELYYNDQNDRIATWISKYKADNEVDSINRTDIESISSFL